MKLRLTLSITAALTLCSIQASDWRIHPTFDGEINYMVDTPSFTYFTGKVLPDNNFFPTSHSLFRYDKEGEELQSLSTINLLSDNTVSLIGYCSGGGYLAVVYSNYDIDLIYDNGDVVNIPAYRLVSLSYSKMVNSISFSSTGDMIYLATDFGYVAINAVKHEVAESGIYGEALTSVARIGDRLLAIRGNSLLAADAAGNRFSIDDFEEVGVFDRPYLLQTLGDSKGLLLTYGGSPQAVRVITVTPSGVEVGNADNARVYNVSGNKDGIMVATSSSLWQYQADGSRTTLTLPDNYRNVIASSYDYSEIWLGNGRKGVSSMERNGDDFVVTRDYMIPDAPAPYISTHIAEHPSRGLLVINFGYDYNFWTINIQLPLLLSGYKDGGWSNYSPIYTNPAQGSVIKTPNGIAVDPDNPDYVYVSSVSNGVIRMNLKDSSDIIHMSKPSDPGKNLPGFIAIVADPMDKDRKWACRFSEPHFDTAGNLWMSYADMDNQTEPTIHLMCWEAEDRRSTTSVSDFRAPKWLRVKGVKCTNVDEVVPLTYRTHRNWLLYSNKVYENAFAVIDTNGTPTEPSDDNVVIINTLYDQDGNAVSAHNVRCMWEDPSTGRVWVGHDEGLFYFNPDDFMAGDGKVTRIKVARNDGTNLADYLLNLVPVNHITSDGAGRKWFSTKGGGMVCLSADGRSVEEELTSGLSLLPDDVVYCAFYIPSTNSMMISTSGGLVEYYLSHSASSSEDAVKAYPNPVRPDYTGFVIIDGLPDDAVVKIVDASGNLVKELRAEGGEARWDVTNHGFKRVSSGVYFVMSSGIDSDEAFTNVTKILVVN